MEHIYKELDRIIENINKKKLHDDFYSDLYKRREKLTSNIVVNTNHAFFEILIELIAYSQQAKAEKVAELINSGLLKETLCNYDYKVLALKNPVDIVDGYLDKNDENILWENIKAIRQKTKIFQIIRLARVLFKHENFAIEQLNLSEFPVNIKTQNDIDVFWSSFSDLLKKCKEHQIPFISSSVTTLLHFLMHIGYDCIKPDSSVIRVFKNLKLIENAGQKELKYIVKIVQSYCIVRDLNPAEVDLYLMIEGGQSFAEKYIVNKNE
jgi:hypothetical protein